MLRTVIEIDEDKCTGCGICADACHEGAIAIVDGKAKLVRDDFCDGLGDCLPTCPTGAITFVEREAADYNEQAVADNKRKQAIIRFDEYAGELVSSPIFNNDFLGQPDGVLLLLNTGAPQLRDNDNPIEKNNMITDSSSGI